ncbi:MAG: O-methyltransferase [Puniceicoccaceae bacterium]
MKERIKTLLNRIGAQTNASSLRAAYDANALMRFAKYLKADLPWTTSAVAPRALAVLANEVVIHQRRNIVECGCGISTLVLADILAPLGGQVTTIDDDPDWIEIVKGMTAHLSNINFVHAPLSATQLKGTEYKWYDTEILSDALAPGGFDMVFVDGPKATESPLARYPAYYFLKEYLSEDFVIFLDDTARRGEREISRLWQSEGDYSLQFVTYRGDLSILRPRSTKATYCII